MSHKKFNVSDKVKISLINLISKTSGHSGIAGGQYSDLKYEYRKKSLKKITEMQIKKTGKLFSFCCMAPTIILKKNKYLNIFEKLGSEIGLLFQISDDLIDYKGSSKKAGKKTKKDQKKGKATLINLLGYDNTFIYAKNIKNRIFKRLKKFGKKSKNLKETVSFILSRTK